MTHEAKMRVLHANPVFGANHKEPRPPPPPQAHPDHRLPLMEGEGFAFVGVNEVQKD